MELVNKVKDLISERSDMLSCGFYADTLSTMDEHEENGKAIESPIEQLFFIEWSFYQFGNSEYYNIYLEPQYKDKSTGKYRIDFMVDFIQDAYIVFGDFGKMGIDIIMSTDCPRLGIELDGHDFHEKTKKQVEYYKERERFLITNGWTILRFAGSEVYKDSFKYVGETLKIVDDMKHKYHKEIVRKLKELIKNKK